MDWFARDLRTGLRLLARDKAYSLTAATTLALCLAANTALFSVVHHVLLRPLPVPEPERILLMSNQYPGRAARATARTPASPTTTTACARRASTRSRRCSTPAA